MLWIPRVSIFHHLYSSNTHRVQADTINFGTTPHFFRQPSHSVTSEDQLTTSHETTLVGVLRTIRGNLPPPEYTLPASAPASMAFDVRIRELKWDKLGSTLAKVPMAMMRRDIDMWREWCVENVRLRGRAWSSLLKVMVQFVDLFIRCEIDSNFYQLGLVLFSQRSWPWPP